ncbi:cytochrome-c oxidase, cbb3-type subunit II [Basilea psittacipulmonis]|uniref:Peptidase S41 n=1 Tax=Basilea psittacipulmonis DSM 24701 TaxID=1072685 RepID=A0A077DBW8_9BURK|nr:cytochrome-c oxidase, cbb3-type subunit II [Basilea psittacipulmonis]AIL32340.1 peptidase S41 [Basilea psittacipulmonis DSM 24701]
MSKDNRFFSHGTIEKHVGWLIICTIITVAFAGLVQIVPLFFQHYTTEPAPGVKPDTPLQLIGRDVYIAEGCVGCHSQQVRTLYSEVLRYGPYSVAGESVYEHPFLWGSKRTGPDLARLGGRYSDDWHRSHLRNPRSMVLGSVMPSYPHLQNKDISNYDVQARMKALRILGVPYTDEQIANAPNELKGKTEEDALVAYLQNLGVGYVNALNAPQEGK